MWVFFFFFFFDYDRFGDYKAIPCIGLSKSTQYR